MFKDNKINCPKCKRESKYDSMEKVPKNWEKREILYLLNEEKNNK